jgi:hypothetical protein
MIEQADKEAVTSNLLTGDNDVRCSSGMSLFRREI